MRTQEDLFHRYFPKMMSSTAIFRENATVYGRHGVKGEEVVTDLKNGTKMKISTDDAWVLCGFKTGEYYVLTAEEFMSSYNPYGKRASNVDPSLMSILDENGFLEFRSVHKIVVVRVREDDIKWLNENCNHSVNTKFLAPCGCPMEVKIGDVIAMNYPPMRSPLDNLFYRIPDEIFRENYVLSNLSLT